MTLEELNEANIVIRIEGGPCPITIHPGTPQHDELVGLICGFVSAEELADDDLVRLGCKPVERHFNPLGFQFMPTN
jgi:hypothetical protein